MPLTAITTLDIPGTNQIITFNNPSEVDKITFASNVLTFASHASFDLSKSDFLLYFSYLNIYNTALLLNFPPINSSLGISLPLCEFNFKVGPTRITYLQKTNATEVISLTYFIGTQIMNFAARPSNVPITIQEFFMTIYMLDRYSKEIGLQ